MCKRPSTIQEVSIGFGELLILGLVLLLLFGAGRLSEVGRSLGAGLRDLKRGLKSADDDQQPSSEPDPGTSEKRDPDPNHEHRE
jgi:TatA/E family protein of Tat protein translocase